MMYGDFHYWIRNIYCVASSNFFANTISFLNLLICVGVIIKGWKVLSEFDLRKQNAIFSYHKNLERYISRLKRHISDDNGNPSFTLYLFSNSKEIRDEAHGYELFAKSLKILSQKILDYLSIRDEQIPAANNSNESEKWDTLIHTLSEFLMDFHLCGVNSYLPNLSNVDKIKEYHKELIDILKNITDMIKEKEQDYWKNQNKYIA